ncbi:hypothetical protein HHK36_007369 [Tetracentron sinense]|uniref:FCP1 homology domain-containing protein n=1 Tax=Tetracentron sinense TaxID=13715 RepID=A0A834ZIT8_TETSI|nr:hypothetical protein HHK36_007369 [Tetracentron sinense]
MKKNKVHDTPLERDSTLQSSVNSNLKMDSETTQNHAEGSAKEKKKKRRRKRQKKRTIALENNDQGHKQPESGSLSSAGLTTIQHLDNEHMNSSSEVVEIDSMRMKKNHDVLMDNNLISEELSGFSKSADANSIKKNDEPADVNLVSLNSKSIKTYRRKKLVKYYERKKKKLVDSGNNLEQSKEKGSSTSKQVVQNSLMKEISVNCSDHAFTSERNEASVKNEDEFIKVEETVPKLNVSEREKLEELPNMFFGSLVSKLERVQEAGPDTSLLAVEDRSRGDVLVDCSFSGLASGKHQKRIKMKKVKETIHGDSSLEDLSMLNLADEHFEHEDKLNKILNTAQEHGFSVEDKLEESTTYCKKDKKISSLESGDTVEHVRASSVDLIHKEDNSSESCTDGRKTSSPAVEDVPIGEPSANCFAVRPTSKKRVQKMKAKPSNHEDKASDATSSCDPSLMHLEERNGEIRNELERAVEGCHLFGEQKFEVSPTECKMEGKISSVSNVDMIKDVNSLDVINKKFNSMEVSHSSLERAPIGHSRRNLLILDLNGLLVDIVIFVPDGYKPDKKIAGKALFKRPFCDDFLKFCFERFDVGVWSSRMKRNVDSVVDFLMGDMKNNLLFCWDQSHCTETGYNTVENRHKPLVLKELHKLWEKHESNLPWEKGEYNESNTLLLDDSPYKALRNPPNTAVFPYTYRFEDTNDNSLGQTNMMICKLFTYRKCPGGDLRVYLEGLAMAEDTQKYIEQHPFGQRAITKTDTSWRFYLGVIGTDIPTRRYQYHQ